ncbi:MptD family putative ECF transporter S component [Vagococcus entomophilus]|uniref:ABC transporter permease n=1 Tax=Vagococcus entomophilus TaxID=1160095 RepID=A0A430AFM5_9ENTE|nr:MptD family putative ECF transporter S component [Vagococcus entomophilus]RSU06528.1 ABC transporter permease [Vagococcus entomophilus]
MSKKLSIQDLIRIGVYTAIYFITMSVGTFVSFILLPGFSSIFTPAIVALFSGVVYLLLAQSVQKFGAITIMSVLIGGFFLISGHFFLAFLANVFFGFLADIIAKMGKYRKRYYLIASYVVYAYGLIGPILPLWFMKNLYIKNLLARGKDAAYVERIFSPINTGSFFLSMIATCICGIIGGVIGYKLYEKHFYKTGISE